MTVKTGTLVDATVIPSASHHDDEAAWAAHRKRKAIHGFKAHVGADADTAIVEELSVTPGNVNDGRAGGGALPDDPGDVYAAHACGPKMVAIWMAGAVGGMGVGRSGSDQLLNAICFLWFQA